MSHEESIFLRAIEIGSRAERTAFLDEACRDDVRMRASVESLLKHHGVAGRFLELPPPELQQTFADWQGDTMSDSLGDRTLDLLQPSAKPGCIGELGTYEILDVIGCGGMGVVLRARDPKLHRIVAIKLMKEAMASRPFGLKRFLREAQAAASVKHDHVVTIHSVHDEGPLPYLVMELVEGVSLERKIEGRQPLPVEEIVRIGSQIAAGLDAAHQRGLVHRDIKPANILLEAGTQRVKITDFGLARAVADANLTLDGELAGTPQYMSPEQARGEAAEHRSDLFSLGSVLYTLCTGRLAFSAASAVATLRKICDERPQPIHEANSQIPDWLEEVVDRLLQKDPARRPQSAKEVMELLNRRAGPTGADLQPAEQARKSARDRRQLAVLVGVLAIALAGIVVVVNRNGKSTRVEVPDGASVRVASDGAVVVDLPGDRPTNAAATSAAGPPKVDAIVRRLVELNPGFDGQIDPIVVDGEVVEVKLIVDHVTNLSPLQSFARLRNLSCAGSAPGSGQLADLSPLKGMHLRALDISNSQVSNLAPLAGMPLERLFCAETNVSDLAPLAGMPLTHLQVQGTHVASILPLRGVPLVDLNISFTQVTDLSPLQGMKLIAFYCDATRIADLSPLAEMPLKNFNWRGYEQSEPRFQRVVRSIATLESIDGLPAAEFWQGLAAKRKD